MLNEEDALDKHFKETEEFYKKELEEAEKEIKKNLEIINRNLAKVEEEIKKAEKDGDELAYQVAMNKKQLILQKLQEFESLMKVKIK
jgi:CHASE3 domain sensor protein